MSAVSPEDTRLAEELAETVRESMLVVWRGGPAAPSLGLSAVQRSHAALNLLVGRLQQAEREREQLTAEAEADVLILYAKQCELDLAAERVRVAEERVDVYEAALGHIAAMTLGDAANAIATAHSALNAAGGGSV